MSKNKKQKPVVEVTPDAGGPLKVRKIITSKSKAAIALSLVNITAEEVKQLQAQNPEASREDLKNLRKLVHDVFLDDVANSQEAQGILNELQKIAHKVNEKFILLSAEEIKARGPVQ